MLEYISIPSTTKPIIFGRLPIISILGFTIGTCKNDGYGSQWYFVGPSVAGFKETLSKARLAALPGPRPLDSWLHIWAA